MSTTDPRRAFRVLSRGHRKDIRHVWYSLAAADLDPAEVTQLTGIEPDRSWRRGDPKPRTGVPYPDGAWLLDSGLAASDEFHDHLDALIARLRPAWTASVDVGHRYERSVDAAIHCLEAQGPLVQILPDVASSLGELNATLGLDIYAVREDRDTLETPRVTFVDGD